MSTSPKLTPLEDRFLAAIKHHLRGWKDKIEADFGQRSYDAELAQLRSDPVYSKFAFDCPEYVMVRLMGRMSISVGRRLGEIYDKIPRYVASARFDVTPEQVAEKFNGLELDIGLRFANLQASDRQHVIQTLKAFGMKPGAIKGLGIEIRYNFNPNDSSRLRKDVAMAQYVEAEGLFPLYLIYSAISPRDEAIARLTRAGWTFLKGQEATNFTTALFGIDFLGIMENPKVKNEIHTEVRSLMGGIFESYAFGRVVKIETTESAC